MFGELDIVNYVNTIKSSSDSEKRKLVGAHKDIHNIIVNYCLKNDIIVSDPKTLVNRDRSKKLSFDLYSPYPFKHATLLSNELMNATKFVEMRTLISRKEFVIYVNLIQLINMYDLPYIKKEGVDVKFINTLPCSVGDIKLQFLSPEIELMDIYHKLYTPTQVDGWETLLQLEDELFSCYQTHMTPKKTKPTSSHTNKSLIKLKQYMLDNWCTTSCSSDIIVIGYWAYVLYQKLDVQFKNERLQVISANNIKNDILALETLSANYSQANSHGDKLSYQISYVQQNVNIPKDFRIQKYAINIVNNGKKITIMEIYNSSSFELIPFVSSSFEEKTTDACVKLGNPFVLLRYYLIDYWLLRYITALGKIPINVCSDKLGNIMKCIEYMRTKINMGFGKNYVGQFINEQIADKLRRMDTERHAPYLPYVKKRTFLSSALSSAT